jgi:cyclopropane-fatty-acyl-phospholipid synthase
MWEIVYLQTRLFSNLRYSIENQYLEKMKKAQALHRINLLLDGSGVKVNGQNPWDIQINYQFLVQFYYRIIRYGSLGLGESRMDEWWNCQKLDEFFTKILNVGLDRKIKPWRMIFPYLKTLLFNYQPRLGRKK